MDDKLKKLDEVLKSGVVEDITGLKETGDAVKRGVLCLHCDNPIWSFGSKRPGRKLYCSQKCKDARKWKVKMARELRQRILMETFGQMKGGETDE